MQITVKNSEDTRQLKDTHERQTYSYLKSYFRDISWIFNLSSSTLAKLLHWPSSSFYHLGHYKKSTLLD